MKTKRLSILLATILLCCQISARTTITDTLDVTPTSLPPFARKSNGKRVVTAFRSNLLIPLLNIGAEIPISDSFSLAADCYYPWVPRALVDRFTLRHQISLQCLGGYIEGRWWPGSLHKDSPRYRLLGHSVALIVAGAYYDYEMNPPRREIPVKDWNGTQGEIFASGIGYMFALPVGRKGNIRLEFDFALGVAYHIRHPYNVFEENGYLFRAKDSENISIRNKSEILAPYPIKAGISLVVPIYSDKPAHKECKL